MIPTQRTQLLLFLSWNHFSLHDLLSHLTFAERTLAAAYISLFPFCLSLLQSYIGLYSPFLFPCSNFQDWFLLWNVLHIQMLDLARTGNEIKRGIIPPALNNRRKKPPDMMNQETFMPFLILTPHVQVMLITAFSFLITVLDELYDF